MPTKLTKPVVRASEREAVIIELHPEGIFTRLPRSPKRFGPLSIGALHLACVRVSVAAAKAEKDARRKTRRKSAAVSRSLL